MGRQLHTEDRAIPPEELETRQRERRRERLAAVEEGRRARIEAGGEEREERIYTLHSLVYAYLESHAPEDSYEESYWEAYRASMGRLYCALSEAFDLDMKAETQPRRQTEGDRLDPLIERRLRSVWRLTRDAIVAYQGSQAPFPGHLSGAPLDALQSPLGAVYAAHHAYRQTLVEFITASLAVLTGTRKHFTSSELLDWGFDDRTLEHIDSNDWKQLLGPTAGDAS